MSINLRELASFGVAGNFTGHLEQAGEASDFTKVKTLEVNAPKALFPTYIPGSLDKTPAFLNVFPFDADNIIPPKEEQNLQIEPECGIICETKWDGEQLVELKPVFFGASNDCSIRKQGAKKISEKKNWGASSKGLSDNLIAIDKFDETGVLGNYRIASFMVRDDEVFAYGEDSKVNDYSYIYEKLIAWLLDKLNHQVNEGPAEDIHSYLLEANQPSKLFISIGATRYTEFGEKNYLKQGDLSVVVLYPETKYNHEQIVEFIKNKDFKAEDISFLVQKVG